MTGMIIRIIIAALAGGLVLLLLVLLVNTAVKTARARRLTDAPGAPGEEECMRCAERLQRMIQCRTISVKDSYDDSEFARLREVMAGLFPLLDVPHPGKGRCPEHHAHVPPRRCGRRRRLAARAFLRRDSRR